MIKRRIKEDLILDKHRIKMLNEQHISIEKLNELTNDPIYCTSNCTCSDQLEYNKNMIVLVGTIINYDANEQVVLPIRGIKPRDCSLSINLCQPAPIYPGIKKIDREYKSLDALSNNIINNMKIFIEQKICIKYHITYISSY